MGERPREIDVVGIDVMNHIHHSLPEGKSLRECLRMKGRLIAGSWQRAPEIHLHADDPENVVFQNAQEHDRRNETKAPADSPQGDRPAPESRKHSLDENRPSRKHLNHG